MVYWRFWISSKHQRVWWIPGRLVRSTIATMYQCIEVFLPFVCYPSSSVPIIEINILLNLSQAPFPLGWYGVVLHAMAHNFFMTFNSKFLPWSEWSRSGNPFIIINCSYNALVVSFISGTTLASFVKWSVITSRCLPWRRLYLQIIHADEL